MNAVNLTGIPETMLWTLHNRASEAKRADSHLQDPECVRVYEAIDYDYSRNFGRPDDSHPMRSKLFDEAVRPWMKAHPGGTVVELGAGLETQFHRCDDGQVQWLCIGVPEAMTVRDRFIGVEIMFDVIPPWFSRKALRRQGAPDDQELRRPVHAVGRESWTGRIPAARLGQSNSTSVRRPVWFCARRTCSCTQDMCGHAGPARYSPLHRARAN